MDKRDNSILLKPVNGMLTNICYFDLHMKLCKKNFTFKMQNKKYYQWYADIQEQKAKSKPCD